MLFLNCEKYQHGSTGFVVIAHNFNSSRDRQNSVEFEASLGYPTSSRPTRDTQQVLGQPGLYSETVSKKFFFYQKKVSKAKSKQLRDLIYQDLS